MLTDYTVIFGGSFDPPHVGHQAMVTWLIQSLDAREVIVCPTYVHCFGKKLTPFEDRIQMCKLAFESAQPIDPAITKRITISRVEKGLPEPNLTFNLLKWYKAQDEDRKLAFVVGADNLSDISKWAKWQEATEIAKVIAIGRPGFELKEDYDFNHDVYPVGISTISSSEVRKRIADGLSIEGFVPKRVKDYMYQRGELINAYSRSGQS